MSHRFDAYVCRQQVLLGISDGTSSAEGFIREGEFPMWTFWQVAAGLEEARGAELVDAGMAHDAWHTHLQRAKRGEYILSGGTLNYVKQYLNRYEGHDRKRYLRGKADLCTRLSSALAYDGSTAPKIGFVEEYRCFFNKAELELANYHYVLPFIRDAFSS